MILFILSLVAGVLTVLAPCILPLLPVIIGSSIADGKSQQKKAITIVVSLGVSVILFTFLLKASTIFIDIPQATWTWISGIIVLFFGLATFFPKLWENQILARLNVQANAVLGAGNRQKGFWGDVVIGAALGPVFSTCSPTYFIVLATVLPVNLALGSIYLLAYVAGLCVTLYAISLVGQNIINKLGIASDPDGKFKKILGVLFIIVGIAILSGIDKKIEAGILSVSGLDITRFEQYLLQKTESPTTLVPAVNKNLPIAPDVSSIDGYINTDGKPISLAELRGDKVVLIDFWTYSCINCQRTIPYLNEWYAKYKDQGLEIIGVHTPEFAFEKNQTNVENAVKEFEIKYPVVLDNDFSTWKSYGNRYWPRKYLVDVDGYVVYDHIGEGAYEETEKAIQDALADRAERLKTNQSITKTISKPKNVVTVDTGKVKTPEIYFGAMRNEYLGNGRGGNLGEVTLHIPVKTEKNLLYLEGTWDIKDEYAELVAPNGEIEITYEAKKVYMVASSNGLANEVEIWQDGKLVKKITIQEETLYTLIDNPSYGVHKLEIRITKPGLNAFTFTFG